MGQYAPYWTASGVNKHGSESREEEELERKRKGWGRKGNKGRPTVATGGLPKPLKLRLLLEETRVERQRNGETTKEGKVVERPSEGH